jgi:hypothetical protein
MANTYSWVISQLETYPQIDSRANVVFNIHWRRQATDGKGHHGDVYGSQAIEYDSSAPFTPYENLTDAQVIGWLAAAIGNEQLATYDGLLDQQIADQIRPPISNPPLPWA